MCKRLSTYSSVTYFRKANDFSNIINLDKARFSVAVHLYTFNLSLINFNDF